MSYDGQAYRQPMVYALANDWNPVYNSHNPIIDCLWNMNIWIDHYPKGMEISAATITSMTGSLEMGKSVNTIFLLSTLMMAIHLLKNSDLNLPSFKLYLYSFLIACPMIFVNYGLTFYIDIATYYLIFWILCFFYILQRNGKSKRTWYLLFVITVLSICIKLNICFWILYSIIIYCFYLILKKELRVFAVICSITFFSFLWGLLVINYNPIITNYVDHHNPIYPIGELEGKDIDKNATPYLLKDKNRISQVLISLFSRPNDNMETSYQNPYHISYRLNIRSLGYGAKLGGGGLFFMEVLITSFILVVFSKRRKEKQIVIVVSLLFMSTLFILPFGSNYRYVPFITLLPIIILLYTEKAGFKYKCLYGLKSLCFWLFILNNIVSMPFFIKNTYLSSKSQKDAISYIQNSKSPHPYRTKNWSFNYKIHGNQIVDKDIFSDKRDDYYAIPDQFGPAIYLYKDYFDKNE
jgi:hypothetical protein